MDDKYKMLISDINNVIKPLGFKKNGNTFFYHQDNNIGLINFQKSKNSSSESILFTISVGVYSNSLHVFDSPEIGSKPAVSDCHWRERIGFLLPEKKDHWWQINSVTLLSDLTKEVINLLTSKAIPEIKKYISDESLQEYWMEGVSSGLSKQQMYLYLIALLKLTNDGALQSKINELKAFSLGKPFQQNVNESLMKLGINE
jgi:hypothetical protein